MKPYKSIIHLCNFCGEKTSGKFCPTCRTKEQRKEKIKEQLAIEEERKGYKVSDKLFGFNRKKVLELYNL